ncbi:hypothetical protein BBJ28_00012725 [Nothophytophthora sp. Chile5]|nr:hypothetical protein BBJ28_00012725 [Nothophytophthora sp. Chile5]
MCRFRGICTRLMDLWLYLQVELHGHYSIERMCLLQRYNLSTSLSRVCLATALAPFPCLLILTLIDVAPLAPTEDGSNANYMFWMRDFVTIALMTRAIVEQLHLSIPSLEITPGRVLGMSLISSAGAVAFMVVMARVIGFPLPFALVVGIPIWFAVLVVSFGCFFGAKLKREAALRQELLNYIVVIACQVVLTFIYPAYLYGFRSVDATAQTFYVLLLPVVKIATKNWISFFLGKKDDLKPQIVILNIEVFNALYVASSMQNSSSISTTMTLTLIDFVLAWVSINDVSHLLVDITAFLEKIPASHLLKSKDFMEIALQILEEDPELSYATSLRFFSCKTPRPATVRSSKVENVNSSAVGSAKRSRNFTWHRQIFPLAPVLPDSPSTTQVAVDNLLKTATSSSISDTKPSTFKSLDHVFSTKERLVYVQRTAQVLFTTEFIILIEYTEVIIPFIYSMYTLAMFQLPNRVYYPQIRELDELALARTLGNVAIYGMMELLSFIAMSLLLKRKIGISTLHQLAFVLDREWRMVQSNLFLWICYTIQNSLDHNGGLAAEEASRTSVVMLSDSALCSLCLVGADFSWRFRWLRSQHPSG